MYNSSNYRFFLLVRVNVQHGANHRQECDHGVRAKVYFTSKGRRQMIRRNAEHKVPHVVKIQLK